LPDKEIVTGWCHPTTVVTLLLPVTLDPANEVEVESDALVEVVEAVIPAKAALTIPPVVLGANGVNPLALAPRDVPVTESAAQFADDIVPITCPVSASISRNDPAV
jgi:hypothetical protein